MSRERREETVEAYIFSGEKGKRDSIVVVAQLSPEFTARSSDLVPVVALRDGKAFASSRDVADFFGKHHKNVLQSIDSLIVELPSLARLNFQQGSYTTAETGNQQHGCFNMDCDGFTLLAMGFTGLTGDGNPWFVAQDVCDALGISNVSMAVDRLDADEKMTLSLADSHSAQRGGAQSLLIISEPGLFTLVLRCRDAVKPGSTPLIPLSESPIGGETVRTVNARDLHAFLGVGKDFSTWIKDRISQYGFVKAVDYLLTEIGEQLPSGTKYLKEYFLTLDMAKELAMVERNEKGKEARPSRSPTSPTRQRPPAHWPDSPKLLSSSTTQPLGDLAVKGKPDTYKKERELRKDFLQR